MEQGEAVLNELVDVELKGVRLRLERARRTKPRSPTPGRFYGSRDNHRRPPHGGRDHYRRRSPIRGRDRDRSPMRIVDSYVGSGQRHSRSSRDDRDDRRSDRRNDDYRSDHRNEYRGDQRDLRNDQQRSYHGRDDRRNDGRDDYRYRQDAHPPATGAIYYPPPATAVGYTSAYDIGRNAFGPGSPRY